MVTNFKRQVTHSGFKKNDPDKKYYKGIPKEITTDDIYYNIEHIDNENWRKKTYIDDAFMYFPTSGSGLPFLMVGISLFMIIGGLLVNDTFNEIIGIIVYSIFCFLFIFFTIYYFTKPPKEQILNRMDGLITFTGLYWQKNITMKFEEVEFNYTTGDEDGTSAFILQVVRPTIRSFDLFNIGAGRTCYEDLSMIVWYMDKNRPLPPGTAFDPYRQKDFERRKAEGFPKPLYPSNVPTPEATKEQQQERYKIGGW